MRCEKPLELAALRLGARTPVQAKRLAGCVRCSETLIEEALGSWREER